MPVTDAEWDADREDESFGSFVTFGSFGRSFVRVLVGSRSRSRSRPNWDQRWRRSSRPIPPRSLFRDSLPRNSISP
jgi:hypothetical protein